MNEKFLIQGCQEGKSEYQRLLFDTFYERLYRLVRRYMGNHHDTEDVLIGVFNKILKNINRFEYRGDGSLSKWMNTIAINESLRAVKKDSRLIYPEDMSEFENGDMDMNIPFISIEQVQEILAEMPIGYRTVFNLYAIEEYTHSEIAERLNIGRNTSKSQLLKARKFIIQELKKKEVYEG